MAVDFSTDVYLVAFNIFARPITVTPIASQPGAPAYDNRGILDSKEIDVLTEEGGIFSDSKVILDIRMLEFAVLPRQSDRIDIAYWMNSPGGSFEVVDTSGVGNAGGELTLTLKQLTTAKP
jgi:hypothetical protein